MSKKYLFAMILLLSAPFAHPRAMADRASGAALNQQGANIDAEEEAHHAFELFRGGVAGRGVDPDMGRRDRPQQGASGS